MQVDHILNVSHAINSWFSMTSVAMIPITRSVIVVFPVNDKLQGAIAKFRVVYIMSVDSAGVIFICHR